MEGSPYYRPNIADYPTTYEYYGEQEFIPWLKEQGRSAARTGYNLRGLAYAAMIIPTIAYAGAQTWNKYNETVQKLREDRENIQKEKDEKLRKVREEQEEREKAWDARKRIVPYETGARRKQRRQVETPDMSDEEERPSRPSRTRAPKPARRYAVAPTVPTLPTGEPIAVPPTPRMTVVEVEHKYDLPTIPAYMPSQTVMPQAEKAYDEAAKKISRAIKDGGIRNVESLKLTDEYQDKTNTVFRTLVNTFDTKDHLKGAIMTGRYIPPRLYKYLPDETAKVIKDSIGPAYVSPAEDPDIQEVLGSRRGPMLALPKPERKIFNVQKYDVDFGKIIRPIGTVKQIKWEWSDKKTIEDYATEFLGLLERGGTQLLDRIKQEDQRYASGGKFKNILDAVYSKEGMQQYIKDGHYVPKIMARNLLSQEAADRIYAKGFYAQY